MMLLCPACLLHISLCVVPQVRLKEFQHLVPPHLHNGTPSYFLVGGLVFTACSGGCSDYSQAAHV